MQSVTIETVGAKTKAVFRFTTEHGEVFAKVHAIERDAGFGARDWKMTGVECDADGKAVRAGARVRLHNITHEVRVESDAPEDVRARVLEGLALVAQRVATAAINERTPLTGLES